jgi:hypothetical protein
MPVCSDVTVARPRQESGASETKFKPLDDFRGARFLNQKVNWTLAIENLISCSYVHIISLATGKSKLKRPKRKYCN